MFYLVTPLEGQALGDHCTPVICIKHPNYPPQRRCSHHSTYRKPPVCSLRRVPGAAPGAHTLEHHHPGYRSPQPEGLGEKPSVGEALGSGTRTVSSRYLSSLKNKMASGAWRKSCQLSSCSEPGTQVPEG